MADNYKARTAYVDQRAVDEYEQLRFASRMGRYTWKREQRAVGELIELVETADRVLDMPSGIGRWVPALRRVNPTQIIEADLSPTMLEAAGRSNDDLQGVQCEGERLPFADGSFDLVFCFALLKHLPVPTQALVLSELARVSSGHVICAVSVDQGLPKWVRRLRGIWQSGLSRGVAPQWLDEASAAAGLKIVRSRACTTPVGLERAVLFAKVD